MTMSPDYFKYYDEMFNYITEGPVLIYGVHKNVAEQKMPDRYKGVYDFADWFRKKKEIEAYTLDLFDKSANYNFDLNNPAPIEHVNKYHAVIDIGTIEHVFDVKQVLATSFSMIKLGGFYMLHTVANGLYQHGFYAFSPEVIKVALSSNGFEVLYFKVSGLSGEEVSIPSVFSPTQPSIVMWAVAQKIKEITTFINPQQDLFKNMY
jgi:hypothetical protein